MTTPAVHDLGPLVIAAAAGDREAFGQIVGATSGVVLSISLAILGDLDASRDVAQDVFLAAWHDLRKLRNRASFLPWLRQLTRNRAHHVLRTRVRSRRRGAGALDEQILASVIDPRPDASARIVAREEAAAVEEALAALPDDTREVLTLFYREGQSVAQVAALLDLTVAAVKKRLSRARQSLRAAVLDRLGETLAASAPGAAFTAGIVAALSTTAPATATAATLVASKGLVKAGLGAKMLMMALAAAPGALGAIGGVVLGSRGLMRAARDEEELNGVRRYRLIASCTCILFAFGMPLGVMATGWRYWAAVDFAAFVLALMWLINVYLAGVLQRRFEAEMREDPVRATAQRRRERIGSIIGWSVGLTCGTIGLVAGLWASAR